MMIRQKRLSPFLMLGCLLWALWQLLTAPIAWIRYALYFEYVVRHKWCVLVEGLKLRVPLWRLLIHDWTKFYPVEFITYAQTFRAEDGKKQFSPVSGWKRALNHHYKHHPHHPEYWVLDTKTGIDILPMPDVFRREMLADWRGAGRALGQPDTLGWYIRERDNIKLHADTRAWIEDQLGYDHAAKTS